MIKKIGLCLTFCITGCALEPDRDTELTQDSTTAPTGAIDKQPSSEKATPSAAPKSATAQPVVVKASAATRETLKIDSWSRVDDATGHRLLALDAAGQVKATLLLQDQEDGTLQLAFAGSSVAPVTLAADGRVTGEDSDLLALAKALSADLQAQPAKSSPGGVSTQSVSGCGQNVYPGNYGVCGTTWLGDSRIAITNNTGCWAYIYSQVLNTYATGINDWIAIPPFDTVSFVRWFWGNNVLVYNWWGDCGTINVHH